MLTFSGLHGRVAAGLKKCGYQVKTNIKLQQKLVADLSKLSEEDLANLEDREDQIQVLGMVADRPGGFVVDAPCGWGKSYVARQLCQIFPTARIAVVAPGKEVANMMYKRIKERIRDVGMVGDGQRHIARITVCTMESVDKLRNLSWDLLLCDEVHRAGAPGASNAISEVFKLAKCVGFSASPTGRSDGADLVIEALFGPVAYKVNYSTSADRGDIVPIKVKLYRIDKGSPINTELAVVRNRFGIWRNDLRNLFIAKLASEIPADEQALIMVSAVEHVLYLKKLLPDYKVIFSNMSAKLLKRVYAGEFGKIDGLDSTGNLTEATRAWMRGEFESGRLKRAIATSVWNCGVDFKQLKWLIRADGMASEIQSIQSPGRLARTHEDKLHGTLIDFVDAYDAGLLRRSQARARMYKKNGWNITEYSDPLVCHSNKFSDLRGKNG